MLRPALAAVLVTLACLAPGQCRGGSGDRCRHGDAGEGAAEESAPAEKPADDDPQDHLRADRGRRRNAPPADRLLHPADLEGKPLSAGCHQPEGRAGHRAVHARHRRAAKADRPRSIRSRQSPPRPVISATWPTSSAISGLPRRPIIPGEKRVENWIAGSGGLAVRDPQLRPVDHRQDGGGVEREAVAEAAGTKSKPRRGEEGCLEFAARLVEARRRCGTGGPRRQGGLGAMGRAGRRQFLA